MLDPLDATKAGHGPEASVRGLFAPRDVLGKVLDSGCIHRCAAQAQDVSATALKGQVGVEGVHGACVCVCVSE